MMTHAVAMAVALGQSESVARDAISIVKLAVKTDYIWEHSKDRTRYDIDASIAELVVDIGLKLLKGTGRESLAFTVGSWTLASLHEGPSYTDNLREWVGMWTDGDRQSIERYDAVLAKENNGSIQEE